MKSERPRGYDKIRKVVRHGWVPGGIRAHILDFGDIRERREEVSSKFRQDSV